MHHSSTLPTIFQRMFDLKSKSQFLIVNFFLFYSAKIFKRSYGKKKKRRKETNRGHCLVFLGRYDIYFVRLVFVSFDFHLSLIYKKRPEQKKMGQSSASLLTTYQNLEKSLVFFSKENDISWVTMWLSFLSGVNKRASCMLSHYLAKTVHLFVNTFNLHGLFSAESHNTNTTVNVKDCVVYGPE